VQTSDYLLQCYRYIELNPVRAGMVQHPQDYRWSSYHANALGKESSLRTPHDEYLQLGATEDERKKNYQSLFQYHFDTSVLSAIRTSVSKGLALGDNRFKLQIEEIINDVRRLGRQVENQHNFHSDPNYHKQKRYMILMF
jgi:putative transposase